MGRLVGFEDAPGIENMQVIESFPKIRRVRTKTLITRFGATYKARGRGGVDSRQRPDRLCVR